MKNIKGAIFDLDGTLVDSSVAIATAKKIGMKTVGIYEEFNFEQEKMKEMADMYIDKGEALDKFLSE